MVNQLIQNFLNLICLKWYNQEEVWLIYLVFHLVNFSFKLLESYSKELSTIDTKKITIIRIILSDMYDLIGLAKRFEKLVHK